MSNFINYTQIKPTAAFKHKGRLENYMEKNHCLRLLLARISKGHITAIYVIGIPLLFVSPWLALLMYITVAITWFIPDTRIEKK